MTAKRAEASSAAESLLQQTLVDLARRRRQAGALEPARVELVDAVTTPLARIADITAEILTTVLEHLDKRRWLIRARR